MRNYIVKELDSLELLLLVIQPVLILKFLQHTSIIASGKMVCMAILLAELWMKVTCHTGLAGLAT